MSFASKFAQYPLWNLIGWCVIVAVFLIWEIWGATHNSAVTFTYLLRTTCSSFKYGLACEIAVWFLIGWHFIWTPLIAWVKS